MNNLTIVGRACADAVKRFSPKGTKMLEWRIAVKGSDGNMFIQCVLFGDRADRLEPYIKKGIILGVSGKLNNPRGYIDKQGKPQCGLSMVVSELEMMSSKENSPDLKVSDPMGLPSVFEEDLPF